MGTEDTRCSLFLGAKIVQGERRKPNSFGLFAEPQPIFANFHETKIVQGERILNKKRSILAPLNHTWQITLNLK